MKQQRIILMPGFAENEHVYENVLPFIAQENREFVYADYRPILAHTHIDEVNIEQFLTLYAKHYKITASDVLIGHSTGGWFAHHLKQMLGCENCLVAGFSTPTKARGYKVVFKKYRSVTRFLVLRGWILGSYLQKLRIKHEYGHLPSHINMQVIWKLLREEFKPEDLWKMLCLIDSPEPQNPVEASLRLHALADRVIYPPDEPFQETPGDHFSISTHPQDSAAILNPWLDGLL